MKRGIPVVVLALAMLSACASVHPGNTGKRLADSSELPLKISGRSVDREAGDPFQLVEVTIENTSDDWLRIDQAHVVMDEKTDPKLSVVVGNDLRDWAESVKRRAELAKHNRNASRWWLTGLGFLTWITGAATNRTEVALAGSGAVLASSVLSVADTIGDAKDKAQRGDRLPESHLLHAVAIPGKLFSRRWVVLNLPPQQRIDNLELELETVEGEKGRYVIAL